MYNKVSYICFIEMEYWGKNIIHISQPYSSSLTASISNLIMRYLYLSLPFTYKTGSRCETSFVWWLTNDGSNKFSFRFRSSIITSTVRYSWILSFNERYSNNSYQTYFHCWLPHSLYRYISNGKVLLYFIIVLMQY